MEILHAFFTGMREYRSSFCAHYYDLDLADAYDHGRELAHKLTFRRFEQ